MAGGWQRKRVERQEVQERKTHAHDTATSAQSDGVGGDKVSNADYVYYIIQQNTQQGRCAHSTQLSNASVAGPRCVSNPHARQI